MPKTKKEKFIKPFIARTGSKRLLCDEIISKIPHHDTYVEAFIGGGSIFLKKPLATNNVINDLDKNVYDLWNDIRVINPIEYSFDPSVNATPEIFDNYMKQTDIEEPNERFKRNIFLVKYSFHGQMRFKGYKNVASWRKNDLKYIKDNLNILQDKLRNVNIHNEDFREIIKRYDSPSTFFYFDPPYSSNAHHWYYVDKLKPIDLKNALQGIQGRFILSYDDSDEVKNVFKDDYYIKIVETIYNVNSKGNKKVNEVLISNYDLDLL